MSRDVYGYPCEPRDIAKDEAWFYVQRDGIEIVQELRQFGERIGTAMATIPWRKACAAVDEHRRIKAKKKKVQRR